MTGKPRPFQAHATLRAVLILATIGLSGAPVARAQPQGPPPATVKVDPARTEVVDLRREVTGELRAQHRSLIAAQQPGLVVELRLEEGDPVAAGQVLARLDDTLTKLAVAREEANILTRKAVITERESQLERAKRDRARVDDLTARASASANEADDARTNVNLTEARIAQARAELASAESELALAKERLKQMTVTAPFAGRVVRKSTEVGQWLQAGAPVVEIVSLEHVEARLDVPEALVGRLAGSSEASGEIMVRVRVRALGTEVDAMVTQIVPDADPLSRLFPVRVRLTNDGERLKPGMSVIGLVPTGQREPMVTVHKDGLLRDDAGDYLYFEAGGVAAVARVRALYAVGDRVVLEAGARLPPGAKVIVEGNERLFPGQPLNIVGAGGAPRAGAEAGNAGAVKPAGGGG